MKILKLEYFIEKYIEDILKKDEISLLEMQFILDFLKYLNSKEEIFISSIKVEDE